MKFKELSEWALEIFKKDNNSLIALGVKTEKLSKVKSILRDGISARCEIVMVNTEKNNKCINEIEEFIKQLMGYGLNVIKEVSPETPVPTPPSKFSEDSTTTHDKK